MSYTISFSDEDTGIWDGKGLRFAPGGAMKLDLSRLGYNGGPGAGGNCIQFPGLGGQSAIVMNPTAEEIPPKCGHEINFFAQPESKFKSRSMIVALWALDKSGKAPVLRLSTVGIAPFRDGLAESSGVREDRVRSVGSPGSALDMLGAFKGWKGKREVYKREVQPSGNPAPTQTDVAFDLKTYKNARACLRFPDNLIFAGPRSITGDGPFTLVFACQTASDVFKQVSASLATPIYCCAFACPRVQGTAQSYAARD